MCLLEMALATCSELVTIGFLCGVLLAITLIETHIKRRRENPRGR